MRPRRLERLAGEAAVKGGMLLAHLEWLKGRRAPPLAGLSAEAAALVARPPLVTDWIPFRALVEIDRAIARVIGGVEDVVYRSLGHNSAVVNLRGAYKVFLSDEPHRFFQQAAMVHRRFQNFGDARYDSLGPRSCRLTMARYPEFSPVYCASALGYYDGALEMMGAPARGSVSEASCHCAGDDACVFDVAW